MKKTFMLLLLLFTTMLAMAQGVCSVCRGRGKVVKNIVTSQYGISNNNYKVKCSTCGAVTLKSSGHTHIPCSRCGGTGMSKSNAISYRSNSNVTYDPDSPEGIWARGVAKTLMYGIPYSSDEEAIVKQLARNNSVMAKRWMEYREVLSIGASYFNERIAKISGKWDNVASVDQAKRMYDDMLAQKGTNLQIPNNLYAIYKKYHNIYENAYQEYRKSTKVFEELRNIQERIDDCILQQNLFY